MKDFEITANKGVYGIWLKNGHSGDTSLSLKLVSVSKKFRFPRLFEIGTNVLVVGIPLTVDANERNLNTSDFEPPYDHSSLNYGEERE